MATYPFSLPQLIDICHRLILRMGRRDLNRYVERPVQVWKREISDRPCDGPVVTYSQEKLLTPNFQMAILKLVSQAPSPLTRDKKNLFAPHPFLAAPLRMLGRHNFIWHRRVCHFHYCIIPSPSTFCKSNPYRPHTNILIIKPIPRLIGRGFTGSLIIDHRHVVPRARFELATKGL